MLRYVKFIQSIKKSQATGCTKMEDINVREVKKKMVFSETNEADEWKVDFIKEIVNIKHKVLFLDEDGEEGFDNDDLEDIVDFLSTS